MQTEKYKSHLFIILFILGIIPLKSVAINYTINFTGSGASTTVDSVIVQNLTKGISITVPAGASLNLTDVFTSNKQIIANYESINIYPNSTVGEFTVSFFTKQAGVSKINVYTVDGREVTGINTDLENGNNKFQLSLPKGAFFIKVNGNAYSYSTKLISQSNIDNKPQISFAGCKKVEAAFIQKNKMVNVTSMYYTSGDQLLYKGKSGNYCTIVTDIPTGDKTTNFEFVECKDIDGNNYSVVKIGTQTWMAENLKTTKYNDGNSITSIPISDYYWIDPLSPFSMTYIGGYSFKHYNDIIYRNAYGCFYNLFAIVTGKLAPAGWHIASDLEWTILSDYLGGKTIAGGKLKSISGWNTPNIGATNSTGFIALPGGICDNGFFSPTGYYECWRSSSYSIHGSSTLIYTGNAWGLSYNSNDLTHSGTDQCSGYKIRCVKDN